jgi:hypothetical protein
MPNNQGMTPVAAGLSLITDPERLIRTLIVREGHDGRDG